MSLPMPTWLNRADAALRQLALNQPWTLILLLLALNAVARPCSVTAHDARLYSLQALNQAEGGTYAEDVFLRYGSQDQFSFFSPLIAPLVAELGVRPAFFVLYLVFNTLFIFALFRLVRALVDDAAVSTLSLVFLVSAPLPYGGHDIFMVHEQFFTPRAIGTTLTLFALERIMRQRFLAALFLLAGAALMHPLIACGGVMIFIGMVAATYFSPSTCGMLFFSAVIAGIAVLANPDLAGGLFGIMDDEWHEMVRVAVAYNYPDTWGMKDWLHVAASFLIPIASCFWLAPVVAVRRRFVIVALIAGALGLLMTVMASLLPYALLFQAQPYRVLWILKVIQVPLGFALIGCGCQSETRWKPVASLGLIAYFCTVHFLPPELLILALSLLASLIIGRIRNESAIWWYASVRGLALGAVGWMTYRCGLFFTQRDLIAAHFDFNEIVLFDLVSPMLCVVALGIAAGMPSINFAALRGPAGIVAILTPIGLFAAEASTEFQREHTRLGDDMAFVRNYVQRRARENQRHPSVYCSLGRPDLLWIDVKATSYFDIIQTAGVMFNRRTADEITRRAELVNKFEMRRHGEQQLFLSEDRKAGLESLLRLRFDSNPATRSDLERLAREPGLDLVVIPQKFSGLYSATNGRVYVYDCDRLRLRARAESSDHGHLTANAKR